MEECFYGNLWMVIFSFGSLTHTWFENKTAGLCGWLWLAGWLAGCLAPTFLNLVYFSRSYVLKCFSPKSSDSMFYVCDN